MKSLLAVLLIATSYAAIAQNPPAITPEARERFLNGVNDFAGGKTTPGATQDPPRMGAPGGGSVSSSSSGSNAAPASWRSPDGKVTGGSIVTTTVTPTPLVGQAIVAPTITAPVITPPNNNSTWRR